MNDKQQLAAMGEHLAEQQQPLCMAKRIEELEAQVRVMAELLAQASTQLQTVFERDPQRDFHGLVSRIDAALSCTLPEQHPDDAAVDRFAIAMKAKLAAAREKGRGGWDDPSACSVEFLADLLAGHVGKGNQGNFEDIANLAMMLHQRGADPAVLAGKLPNHTERPLAMAQEGWQLVPVAPTREMREAFHEANEQYEEGQDWDDFVANGDDGVCSPDHQWAAMLAAAPKPDSVK